MHCFSKWHATSQNSSVHLHNNATFCCRFLKWKQNIIKCQNYLFTRQKLLKILRCVPVIRKSICLGFLWTMRKCNFQLKFLYACMYLKICTSAFQEPLHSSAGGTCRCSTSALQLVNALSWLAILMEKFATGFMYSCFWLFALATFQTVLKCTCLDQLDSHVCSAFVRY